MIVSKYFQPLLKKLTLIVLVDLPYCQTSNIGYICIDLKIIWIELKNMFRKL